MKTGTNKMLTLIGLKVQGDLGPITCYTSKHNRVVWYLKAPPLEPPTWLQKNVMNTFRYVADAWNAMIQSDRDLWNDAVRLAHLRITGYNLFTYLHVTGDEEAIRTIERQSGITLPRATA